MNSPSQMPGNRLPRRRKPLNIPRIKSLIVLCVGGMTALGSALTGIGAQVAFGPMLTWMLGFHAEKAKATALRYAVYVSFAAVIGAWIGQSGAKIASYCGMGLMLAIGATAGAIFSVRLAPSPIQQARRRMMQSIGVVLALFTAVQAGHLTSLTMNSLHYAYWNAWWALLGIGLAVGVLTQVTGLAGGVLMVPALYFLGGLNAYDSVMLSMLVTALVSLLPAWSYVRQGLADPAYGNYAVIGGLIGGVIGGLSLMRFQERFVLMFFAVIAMFLSARELYRINMEALPTQETSGESNED